ncbi:MAG: hypothetical protein ABSG25_12915 [Bryobacteraceae bacterium]
MTATNPNETIPSANGIDSPAAAGARQSAAAERASSGPLVGRTMPEAAQALLGGYIAVTFGLLLYLLVKVWPLTAGALETTAAPWGAFTLSFEIRTMLIAALAGGLGAYVHLATSFADYAGNEKLTMNWMWWYLLRPLAGSGLALIVFMVLRGGFLSAGQDASASVNPHGVAALAALTGLFSKQATDKLRETFETLFRTASQTQRKDGLDGPV